MEINNIYKEHIFFKDQKKTLILRCISSFFSLFFSCFICFFYSRYHNLFRNIGLMLIFFLALSDFFVGFLTFVPSLHCLINNISFKQISQGWCIFISFFWEFFSTINFTIATIITFSLYLNFCKKISYSKLKRPILLILFLLAILCGILAFIPILSGKYSAIEQFETDCWINDNVFMLFFYLPLWTCQILMIFFVYKIYKANEIYSNNLLESNIDEEKMSKKYLLFPGSFLICYLPATIQYLISIWNNNYSYYFLDMLKVVLYPLSGCINVLIFGLINRFIVEKIKKCLKCKCFNREINNNTIAGDDEDSEFKEENEYNIHFIKENY